MASSLRFNNHRDLAGKHAFLSASSYHWVNYSDEKLEDRFKKHMDAALGTQLHDLAERLITLKQKLPRSKKTLNSYVNDAIGFRMTPEQVLFASPNAFGTADAISFRLNPETGRLVLRIHDLKNGITPAKMTQLKIYCAFFCIEYDFKPVEIDMIMRIYQNDEIIEEMADPMEITDYVDRIRTFDKQLEELKIANMD